MINYKGHSLSSGIYQIRNLVNNKIYIGSATLFGVRKSNHFNDLRKGKHANSYFQNAWNKYEEINFVFELLEICDKQFLIEREQYYLDLYKPYLRDKGYNILEIAHSSIGFKHTEETKKYISEIQKGKKVSEEVKQRLLSYSKNRVVSNETRKKLSLANIGKKHTNTTKQKLREARSKQILPPLSEEVRLKLSVANGTSVCQYTLDDVLIKCFDSISKASKETGICYTTIKNSIVNKEKIRKQRKKVKWKLKE